MEHYLTKVPNGVNCDTGKQCYNGQCVKSSQLNKYTWKFNSDTDPDTTPSNPCTHCRDLKIQNNTCVNEFGIEVNSMLCSSPPPMSQCICGSESESSSSFWSSAGGIVVIVVISFVGGAIVLFGTYQIANSKKIHDRASASAPQPDNVAGTNNETIEKQVELQTISTARDHDGDHNHAHARENADPIVTVDSSRLIEDRI
jgi:hypothetical protein